MSVPSSTERWLWERDRTGLAIGALRRTEQYRFWFLAAAALGAAAWRPGRRPRTS